MSANGVEMHKDRTVDVHVLKNPSEHATSMSDPLQITAVAQLSEMFPCYLLKVMGLNNGRSIVASDVSSHW